MDIKKKNQLCSILFFGTTTFLGCIILLNSVNWGNSAANNYIKLKLGGETEPSKYLLLCDAFINSYKWTGAIILLMGGYFLFKIIENYEFFRSDKDKSIDLSNKPSDRI
ncbi:hypothetical protein E0485_07840 [Paenibacillus albiflavus]|uniref:Uncharacterized protein n=1 Tax=Paenibacillus albiflavus TaxID=2545760 RepID=A0A4R4EEG7_9BACL|nr:hypothetical protein [Paenibacillus albiflavus]TCZ78406.1 hypothetical protein E0485_07840 [Paenibacillus albiflavus]